MLLQLEIFIRRKIQQYFQATFNTKNQKQLRQSDFVIISRNCWGGQVYQSLGLPYNTPFVGLFIFGPCYMKILGNFDVYMQEPLKFTEKSKYSDVIYDYPIGLLGDAEIHFQHFATELEAEEKWNRRRDRMLSVTDKNSYLFTICDRRLITKEDILAFHDLPFRNKLSFSFDKMPELAVNSHIQFKKKRLGQMPPNGKKRFKLTFLYFNVVHWLNTQEIIRTRFKYNNQ